MPKNLLVINVEFGETRVALIEDGIIAELHVERTRNKTTVGNIYLGRVTRVLPGMQAAFVDIGQERAAFLHVEDLIRPEDFEAYISGGRAARDDDEASEIDASSGAAPAAEPQGAEEGAEPGSEPPAEGAPAAEDPGASPQPKAASRGKSSQRPSRDKRRQPSRSRSSSNGHGPARVSRATPIREVVREGQEIIVQVSKDPIGTKGGRVTSHVSLPGRYVVYMPTIDHVGVSRRIGALRERQRLRESIDAMRPPKGGLIVRTVAEGLTKGQLKADIAYLVRLWGEIVRKREAHPKVPSTLYAELDLVLRTARDMFGDDVEKIVIDDKKAYEELKRFAETFMPERVANIELYEGNEPIFDAYGIEDEIRRALSRKVPLPSGGYLVIDQAEALTAIDVNTGRFVGKGSKDLEETILKTNLEAVEEIAYQLRFRNLGGLIVLDTIDMDRPANREKVRQRLTDLLMKDKARTTINPISDLGLIEMTRKRTRESIGRLLHEPCFYCDGTGHLQSRTTVAYEILRQIRRELAGLPGYKIVVNAHPAVVDVLKSEEAEAAQAAENRFMRRIELVPRREYHIEQFDLQGK
ncbi:MAG: Rne/Rng family ribonuclease [Deltaproteobacteria bacterium]|nr:Rne/Rng family ribonuclease [Deltaproteobacteria bacterium]